jgi:hypothetical protein
MTDHELDARLEKLAVTIRSEMSTFRSDIRSEIKDIRSEVKTEGEITRRHFDVVAEGLKADIKVIADGHSALRDDMASQSRPRADGRSSGAPRWPLDFLRNSASHLLFFRVGTS